MQCKMFSYWSLVSRFDIDAICSISTATSPSGLLYEIPKLTMLDRSFQLTTTNILIRLEFIVLSVHVC